MSAKPPQKVVFGFEAHLLHCCWPIVCSRTNITTATASTFVVLYSAVVGWEGPSLPRGSLRLMGTSCYCTPVSQAGFVGLLLLVTVITYCIVHEGLRCWGAVHVPPGVRLGFRVQGFCTPLTL
jgi:hypothetical protein